MKSWQKAIVSPDSSIRDAIGIITKGGEQICLVVDGSNRLIGVVTDGDVRRGIIANLSLDSPVTKIMNARPRTLAPNWSAEVALGEMRRNDIHHLPVVDDAGTLVGLVTLDSLIAAPLPSKNWVVLMAGGTGSRLKPLTNETPKPMLKIAGRPLLQIIIEGFIRQEFRKFYIAVNYRAEQIESYFGDGSRWQADIRYIHEDRPLGTAGALTLIPERIAEPFLVMNGDILTNVDYDSLIEFHREHRAACTMAVRNYDVEIPFGVIQHDNGNVNEIVEKPVQKFTVNAGIYVVDPLCLGLMSDAKFDMPDLIRKVIAHGHGVAAFPIHEYWLDIGRRDDLMRAEQELDGHFP